MLYVVTSLLECFEQDFVPKLLPLEMLPSAMDLDNDDNASTSTSTDPPPDHTYVHTPEAPTVESKPWRVLYLSTSQSTMSDDAPIQKDDPVVSVISTTFTQGTALVLNSEYIVISISEPQIHVFSTATGEYQTTLLGQEMGVWALVLVEPKGQSTITPNARTDTTGAVPGWNEKSYVLAGGGDKALRIWEVSPSSSECVFTLQGHTSTIRDLRVLNGRPIAVSSSRDSTLRVWDIEAGKCLHTLEGHDASIRCIDVAGNRVVSGSNDFTCRLWDVDTGECLQIYKGHEHQIYCVAFDGERVVSASLDKTVRVWDLEGECLATLEGHNAMVGQMQFVNGRVVTGDCEGKVIVTNLEDFESVEMEAHDGSVTCLQVEGGRIVSGGAGGSVKLWNEDGTLVRVLSEGCETVWRVGMKGGRWVNLCMREGECLLEVGDVKV